MNPIEKRIEQHSLAHGLMAQGQFHLALELMYSAEKSFGENVQLSNDISSCLRRLENYEEFHDRMTKLSQANSEVSLGMTSQLIVQFYQAQDYLNNLQVAKAFDMLNRLAWLPGYSSRLRAQILSDLVFVSALFQLKIDLEKIKDFSVRSEGTLELQNLIHLATGNPQKLSAMDDEFDPVRWERLIHLEKILFDSSIFLTISTDTIRRSDCQYLNSLLDTHTVWEHIPHGWATYSRFDFVLRQMNCVDMSKIDLQNIIHETQGLDIRDQQLWRGMATRRNSDIIRMDLNIDTMEITCGQHVLSLGKKRMYIRFLSEFVVHQSVHMSDLAIDVWGEKYNEKIYNRIRIFVQRVNKDLESLTGVKKSFSLQTPEVWMAPNLQLVQKSDNF